METEKTIHKPVLLQETIDWLEIKDGDVVVDMNLGSAGHSLEILGLGKDVLLVGIDRDKDAIERSKIKLADFSSKIVLEECFSSEIGDILRKHNIKEVNKFLFDLGFSSDQIENSGRGFSFQKNEPLQMTFLANPSENTVTAKTIVNEWSEESIADILFGFGGERFSRRIAREIVLVREQKEINTTFDLVEIITKAVPISYKKGKIHPATKTFQALRIAVNEELTHLQKALESSMENLASSGRIVVISFHSLEDRIVKRQFREWQRQEMGKVLTKKPIKVSPEEETENKRSRSAKLRVFQKN